MVLQQGPSRANIYGTVTSGWDSPIVVNITCGGWYSYNRVARMVSLVLKMPSACLQCMFYTSVLHATQVTELICYIQIKNLHWYLKVSNKVLLHTSQDCGATQKLHLHRVAQQFKRLLYAWQKK